jgi:hypothetical protein
MLPGKAALIKAPRSSADTGREREGNGKAKGKRKQKERNKFP